MAAKKSFTTTKPNPSLVNLYKSVLFENLLGESHLLEVLYRKKPRVVCYPCCCWLWVHIPLRKVLHVACPKNRFDGNPHLTRINDPSSLQEINKQLLHCRKWQFLIVYMVKKWPSWFTKLGIANFLFSLKVNNPKLFMAQTRSSTI